MTKDHKSYGECLRDAALRVGWSRSHLGIDRTSEKKKESELAFYREARAAGVQPASTRTPDIAKALDVSAKAGAALDATSNTFSNGSFYSPNTGQVVKFD